MKLVVKDMDIATGDVPVVILNKEDAALLDVHPSDRVLVRKNNRSIIAVIDIAESRKAAPKGRIGMFEEVLDALRAVQGDTVSISIEKKPASITHIRNKMNGNELTKKEIFEIVSDIAENKLTDIELSCFVASNYTRGMSMNEIVHMTNAMTATGSRLDIRNRVITDIHSIGGVPGNRITMIVVPILAAAGLMVPKTSSRAITSPAGTADTMEVLCNVTIPVPRLKRILKKENSFIIWGGAVNLAPADDRIIKVEHPLSIDAEGQMLASIMAKKASVNATHLLIDIPYGKGAKVATLGEAEHLEHMFLHLGKNLNINVTCMLSDGNQPIGNGLGPALEAKDCLYVLLNDTRGPVDLKIKSIEAAAKLLEFTCSCKRGMGIKVATDLLESGEAHKKMLSIIEAQGKKVDKPEKIMLGKLAFTIRCPRSGIIESIDNVLISKIARLAGAPHNKGAGIFLHKHCKQRVVKGEPLLTIYSEGRQNMNFSVEFAEKNPPCKIR
ncbi:MAG: AMP phosphorylase [Candidatus Aenigmarchaeota archaeon]|nr:AMP phosphorylase [Candidatus Aenigmarchaeota archaeon]